MAGSGSGMGGGAPNRSGTMAALSELAESQSLGRGVGVVAASRAGSRKVSGTSSGVGAAAAAADGVHRKPSNTKGFL